MDKVRQAAAELFQDTVVTKRIYGITLAAALIILVLVIKGPEQRGVLLQDSSGNITGIRRSSLSTQEQYDIRLMVSDAEEIIERDVTLTLKAVNKGQEQSVLSEEEISDAELEAEIDSMLTEIETSDEEVIALPSTLPGGAGIRWSKIQQKDRTGLMLIPVIYLALISIVIWTHFDSGKSREAEDRKEIMRGLPRFCNQLFLMMNAGMILSDAFERICASYLEYAPEDLSPFEKELTEICTANADHRVSTAACISEFASRHNVKELVRIAAILNENEKRGSDVVESLARESSYLWDDRKIVAREQGKLIDTRMSWPLSLLLIILIIITTAPALMNI